MRLLRNVTVFASLVILQTSAALGAEQRERAARILFVGLWDRAFQHMSTASADSGVPVQMRAITHGDTPGAAAEDMGQIDYTGFDLIFVLQIDQSEAHILVDRLKLAKQKNPRLHVVELDRRTTHQELLDDGVLEVDPQVTAYWRGFSVENLRRLLVYARVKYLAGSGDIQPPIPAAASGLYHFDGPRLFTSWAEYAAWATKRPAHRPEQPLVAIFIQQDYISYGNTRVYDALIRALESRGMRVAPMFGSTPDLQPILRECRPALLVLQHHHGPEDTPGPGKKPFLEELGVPYIYAAGMFSGITVKEWQHDIRGVKAGHAQLARHELYGIIEPFLIGARGTSAYGFAMDEPIPERVNRVAERIRGWVTLQQTPAAAKKLAVIYFHKYLGKADIGRPAPEMSRYLDAHESLVTLLRSMAKAGYRVQDVPQSSVELLERMKKGGRNVPSWAPGEMKTLLDQGDPVLIPEKKYREWYERKLSPTARAAVEELHGPPPGRFMTTSRDGSDFIVIPCIRLGNIVLAPQPDRGSLQNRDIVHSRTEPPPHNYLAFYWWLQEEFGAQAMIHFGTHGSDFYLPGKETFLSGDCFPDVIVGAMPNFYVWTIQNTGEAVIAKRRSYSVLVDHGTPPILAASRNAEAENILELASRLRSAMAPPVKAALQRELSDAWRSSPFGPELKLVLQPAEALSDAQIDDVANYLEHVSTNNLVQGMHVLGVSPPAERSLPFLVHIVARNSELIRKLQSAGVTGDVNGKAKAVFEELLVKKTAPSQAAGKLGLPENFLTQTLAPELALAGGVWDGLNRAGDEITNLLACLEGKYVPPGPGGDPILRPDALPTGRNLYGLSPQEIPTRQAWDLARSMTDEFIAKFQKEQNRYPEKLAFAMTGMETFRDMGVMEAQVLYLLGIQPEWSPGKLISGLKLIPREELGRPRIDVVMSVNGIYLKDFPSCVRLLDEAVRMAAAAREPDNAVRRHTAAIESDLAGTGVPAERARELAVARVFGSQAGTSSARLVWFLPRSGTWQERQEIVDLWRTMRTHAYTGELWGEKLPELHDKVYAGVEGVIANWSDNLLSPLTNHHYPEETGGLALSVQWINGRQSDVSIFDLRNKDKPGAIGLEEVLSLELRSVALNKDWIRGQMDHGYLGATQFMQIVDNSFQWEAVRQGAVWPGAWEKMVDVYVRDSLGLGLREWFGRTNPFAFQELTATLMEAARKGYWTADPESLRQVVLAHAQSVASYGHGAGPYAGGNERLRDLLAGVLNRPEDAPLKAEYARKIREAEVSASDTPAKATADAGEARPAPGRVAGTKMEQVAEPDQPAARSGSQSRWALYGGVGAAALVLVFVGYWLRVGVPSGD